MSRGSEKMPVPHDVQLAAAGSLHMHHVSRKVPLPHCARLALAGSM
jgi:hypothetical protein